MNCGFVRNYIERGDLIEEYFHNNGKKEGIYRILDSKGNIFIEAEYINDKKNGICKIYDPYKMIKYGYRELYYNDDKLDSFENYEKYEIFEMIRFYYKDRKGYYIFKHFQ